MSIDAHVRHACRSASGHRCLSTKPDILSVEIAVTLLIAIVLLSYIIAFRLLWTPKVLGWPTSECSKFTSTQSRTRDLKFLFLKTLHCLPVKTCIECKHWLVCSSFVCSLFQFYLSNLLSTRATQRSLDSISTPRFTSNLTVILDACFVFGYAASKETL